MKLEFILSPLTVSSNLNDADYVQLISNCIKYGHESGVFDVNKLILAYTQTTKELTQDLFESIQSFQEISLDHNSPIKLARKGISRVLSLDGETITHNDSCVSPMLYFVEKRGDTFIETIVDNFKREIVFKREVIEFHNLIDIQSEPQRAYQLSATVDENTGEVVMTDFEEHEYQQWLTSFPPRSVHQATPMLTVTFDGVDLEKKKSACVKEIVETLLNNDLINSKSGFIVDRIFSNCSGIINKQDFQKNLATAPKFTLKPGNDVDPLPLKLDKSGDIYKLKNSNWVTWKVEKKTVQPLFIVSGKDKKNSQLEVIFESDRVLVCTNVRVVTSSVVLWTTKIQVEWLENGTYTVSPEVMEVDGEEDDIENDSFENFVADGKESDSLPEAVDFYDFPNFQSTSNSAETEEKSKTLPVIFFSLKIPMKI
ncbi:hypothetical protein CAEBREN_19838 [Caenorhabditis brenneri]|uniref:Uncharacterized protein n=1 Tax=Caenorhabditis brenneri TaxID=135651 RepID=G0P1H2_CAEBE|nr:hypothetical protein CAEBREN_19838 [Caenorhabditis brenneri]